MRGTGLLAPDLVDRLESADYRFTLEMMPSLNEWIDS